MKYEHEVPKGLKKLSNADFDHRLGGAPTPDIDWYRPSPMPKEVKQLSKEQVQFNKGNHLPPGKK